MALLFRQHQQDFEIGTTGYCYLNEHQADAQ